MTINEKVNALIGPAALAHTAQIEALVELCKDEATQYCNLENYSERLDSAVVQMVLERFNRLSNEGVSSTTASGIDESFLNGYSNSTIHMLQKNRKLRAV